MADEVNILRMLNAQDLETALRMVIEFEVRQNVEDIVEPSHMKVGMKV